MTESTSSVEWHEGLRVSSEMGGLTPLQVRQVKELISANLDGDISIDAMAQLCGLSSGHFARAFRKTIGMAPHQWLLQRRIAIAQQLLRNAKLSLSEVALASGFVDQSHFTRVFGRITGASPGQWRKTALG
ncbi:helix-turn-helix domain-containing protein [Bradyrhizobium sp.]|uniref:helix-turn-helix domain-containing protein n=1 Tax=Bradyrhizobium sp. TaxID=376 RepID=UPI0025B8E268|nr:AraC family transcriptional regulator [Bradyrhizobium sp.]